MKEADIRRDFSTIRLSGAALPGCTEFERDFLRLLCYGRFVGRRLRAFHDHDSQE